MLKGMKNLPMKSKLKMQGIMMSMASMFQMVFNGIVEINLIVQTIRKNRILTFRSITRALDYIGIFIMIISILHIKEFLFTNVNQIAEFHLLMDGLNTEMEVKQVICQL